MSLEESQSPFSTTTQSDLEDKVVTLADAINALDEAFREEQEYYKSVPTVPTELLDAVEFAEIGIKQRFITNLSNKSKGCRGDIP